MSEDHRLGVLGFALALGVTGAVFMLFLGLAGWLFDWGTALVNLIASLYIGFAPTFPGSILGAIWGFIDGFIGGVVLAWTYNQLQKLL
jgi:hypothetical protein